MNYLKSLKLNKTLNAIKKIKDVDEKYNKLIETINSIKNHINDFILENGTTYKNKEHLAIWTSFYFEENDSFEHEYLLDLFSFSNDKHHLFEKESKLYNAMLKIAPLKNYYDNISIDDKYLILEYATHEINYLINKFDNDEFLSLDECSNKNEAINFMIDNIKSYISSIDDIFNSYSIINKYIEKYVK